MNSVRRLLMLARCVVVLSCFMGVLGALPTVSGAAGFTSTGNMVTPRTQHTTTLLANGKVLIAGGYDGSTSLSSAELYDPATGTFSQTGSLHMARQDHTASLLPGGKVLIAGGENFQLGRLDSAELYDPQTGTFTSTGGLFEARSRHTATTLTNGTVLIAGGYGAGLSLGSAEVYDTATGKFIPTGALNESRYKHTATLLNNGTVLLAGGISETSYWSEISLGDAEIYDPGTGIFTGTGSMAIDRADHSATLLTDGTVLMAGGYAVCSAWWCYIVDLGGYWSEVYDPMTGLFVSVGSLNQGRAGHAAARLDNGKVLIAGGGYNPHPYSGTFAELYDPVGKAFAINAPVSNSVSSLIRLNDGSLLAIGAAGEAWRYQYAEVPVLQVDTMGGNADIQINTPGIGQDTAYYYTTPVSLSYLPGTTVTLTAPTYNSEGNMLVGWLWCDNFPSSPIVDNNCYVTMDSNRTVAAVYAPAVPVTVTTFPEGINIEIDGGYYQTPANFIWPQGSWHPIGAPSPLYQPYEGFSYVFSAWSNGGNQNQDFYVTSPETLTAFYVPQFPSARVDLVYFPTIFDAYAVASNGAKIEAQAVTFSGDLVLNRGIDVSIFGGYDASYTDRTGMTTVQGKVVVESGSLVADQLSII